MGDHEIAHTTNPPNRKRICNDNSSNNRYRKRFHRPRRPVAPPQPAKPVCSVCSDNDKAPTYKCPKCQALYCSVACCKEHKHVCVGKPLTQTKSTTTSPVFSALPLQGREYRHNDYSSDDESLDEGWKITDSMKSALDRSEWLGKELKNNGGLQELISQIVITKDPQVLQRAQERYPNFRVFLDKLLVVAGILERQKEEDSDEEESLSDWLKRDWQNEKNIQPMLTLKQIPRKIPVFEPVDQLSSSSSSSGTDESESEEETSSSDSSSDSGEEGAKNEAD